VNKKDEINLREHRRGYHKWTIQRNWQHRAHKVNKKNKKNNTICVGQHYTQTNTNNVNKRKKTRALLHKTGNRDEANIVFIRKSQRTIQHGTQRKDAQ